MKTIKKISLVLFAALAVSLSSCSSDGGSGGGTAGAGTIKAKVNGSWVTTPELTTAATHSGNFLHIQGTAGDTSSKSFSVNVIAFDGVGTYDIGGGVSGLGAANATYNETIVNISNPMASDYSNWSAPYDGGAKVGEVTVTEITETNVKGTFYFTAKNTDDNSTKEITEGSFNIPLE
ncbi:DUF6252 family protein [Flavobacterium capsici]|uniref:DUF6252 family protein n=1 Tax=Flavobacterium capsici TaxID=3075618 RepID=A0AA96F0P3_9FLAO|nr:MULTISPECIES: DUF6252 family protein [unclassified Flavobacterium]WNM19103.1 DUF6252 family protein [Flavobacterium sp. PMR2A8]WNM20492.1 DUF6252 family protein [Flavobacterium sp. PMTSA4]